MRPYKPISINRFEIPLKRHPAHRVIEGDFIGQPEASAFQPRKVRDRQGRDHLNQDGIAHGDARGAGLVPEADLGGVAEIRPGQPGDSQGDKPCDSPAYVMSDDKPPDD